MNARPNENTLTTRGRPLRRSGGIIGIAVVSLTLTAGATQADVLYNTTWMTDAQSYTTSAQTQNYIGGAANNSGALWDQQVADDFFVHGGPGYKITNVTADYLTLAATPPIMPGGGVLVEFFSDLGGTPSNNPSFQIMATGAAVSASSFANPHTLSTFSNEGIRLSIDVSAFNVTLGAGNWWISIQPVDETENGIRYYQVSKAGTEFGEKPHIRSGAPWHGNGYNSSFPGEFTALPGAGRDLAFSVTGTLIPAPGAFALLGLAGLAGGTRKRRC